jgi:hypothetical protein
LDLEELDGAKLDFDPVGHYAREQLLLNLLIKPRRLAMTAMKLEGEDS